MNRAFEVLVPRPQAGIISKGFNVAADGLSNEMN